MFLDALAIYGIAEHFKIVLILFLEELGERINSPLSLKLEPGGVILACLGMKTGGS